MMAQSSLKNPVASKGTQTIKLFARGTIYNGWIEGEPDRWYLQDSAFDRLNSKEKREIEVRHYSELTRYSQLREDLPKKL